MLVAHSSVSCWRVNIMRGKMRDCDGCHKIMRSDNLKIHMKKYCKELRKDDDGGGDVGDINVKDSQTTTTKSETTG